MFHCEVDGPDWEFTWYRNQAELHGNEFVSLDEVDPYLNVTCVSKDCQGDYSCRVKMESRKVRSESSDAINIKVYGK